MVPDSSLAPAEPRADVIFAEGSSSAGSARGQLPYLIAITVIYIALAFAAGHRRIWYDELFTLDIARAPSAAKLIEFTSKWDLNPPPSYFLARWSTDIFGAGKLGLRLPSMLEFYIASLFLFAIVRRYLGNAFAMFAVFVLWDSPYFYYAAEGRPYALLLMSFMGLLYFWELAIRPRRSNLALAGVLFFAVCLVISHVFAPLSLAGIYLAEMVRTVRKKKIDIALWLALLLPCAAMTIYIPLFHAYGGVVFPAAFQASPTMVWLLYHDNLWTGLTVDLLCAYAVLVIVTMLRGRGDAETIYKIAPEQVAVAIYILATPLLLNVALMRGHGAFWPRYVITCGAVAYLVIAFLFAYGTRAGRKTVYAACVVLVFFAAIKASRGLSHGGPHDASAFAAIRPGLPMVDASGEVFFEMNHYESPEFLHGLYYLKDHEAAMKYAHASMYDTHEPPDLLPPEFEVRAHVEQYSAFVAQHPRFLVVGRPDNPQDWLLAKLQDDGAEVEYIGNVSIPYADSQVFLVHMPAAHPE